jgi:urease subunit gamma/beta
MLPKEGASMKIGEIISCNAEIELNAGREVVELTVANSGDRPIQVGSHFHFFEVNKRLEFDRAAAFGFRLDIPSGSSVRFEPGETKTVRLCALGGAKRVHGLNGLTDGQATEPFAAAALERARVAGFIRKEGKEGR